MRCFSRDVCSRTVTIPQSAAARQTDGETCSRSSQGGGGVGGSLHPGSSHLEFQRHLGSRRQPIHRRDGWRQSLQSRLGRTRVATQIVPIIFKTHTIGTSVDGNGIIATAPGYTTFNPTLPDRACLGSRNNNPLRLFQQSPIFQSADFNYGGTDVGRTQTTDAFQRANFWKVIDREDYHVTLGPVSTFNPIVIDVPAASGLALATTSLGPPAFCAPMAIVDANLVDLFINNNILPALAPHGVNHGTFPIFLLYNAVMSDGDPTNLLNCCILGYHGTGNSDPTATYSPMDFDSTGLFGVSGLDIATATHEVGEWMDDPFGNNPTPPWGHIGQVPGGQGNLEVGDPLSGTRPRALSCPTASPTTCRNQRSSRGSTARAPSG